MVELINSTLINDASLTYYCRFEGNSNDSKGTNNGSDTAITYNASNGKFGQGAGFNGTSSIITLSANSTTQPTGNFTAGIWFKSSSATNQGLISSFADFTGTFAGFYIQLRSDGACQFASGKNSGGVSGTDYRSINGGSSLGDGNWHFVVGVWDGSNVKISVDGSAFSSAVWANAPVYAAASTPRLGSIYAGGATAQFLSGALDDAFLFSRALTITEVQNHYNGADAFGGSFLFNLN